MDVVYRIELLWSLGTTRVELKHYCYGCDLHINAGGDLLGGNWRVTVSRDNRWLLHDALRGEIIYGHMKNKMNCSDSVKVKLNTL